MARLLEDKVILVTGGSSGIGRAAAIAFAAEGAKVVVAARRVAESNETVAMIRSAGGEATFVKTDVTVASEVQALVAKSVEVYGRLDGAFNNAGTEGNFAPAADLVEADLDRMMTLNIKGTWLCMKHEIPQMLKQGSGSIVNMSSIIGLVGCTLSSFYSATKHAVLGLTKCAALDYAAQGIRVNAVCPTIITGTPMVDTNYKLYPEEMARLAAQIPMGRPGTLQEVTATVVWLLSEASSYVTGHAVPIDGGSVAR